MKDTGEFSLDVTHERRILSWSPDPDEEAPEEAPETAIEAPAETAPPEPAAVEPPPAQPEAPPRTIAAPPEPDRSVSPATDAAPRRRGRPRGRPRRQVHFHVDPDEELLLLEAAKKHGSQQKGLVAALQALQDNEILRDEIERLRAECERQRLLLADAEALFNR
jgi:hypothetical protein